MHARSRTPELVYSKNGGNQTRPGHARDTIRLKQRIMKTLITISIGVALFGFSACDSKVESSRKDALESKADALENRADTARKDAKADAANIAKQAGLDADADKDGAKARAEAEKKAAADAAESIRKAGDATGNALDKKAEETREQK